MDDREAALPLGDPAPSSVVMSPEPGLSRWLAALQVLLICGIPTQVLSALVLMIGAGIRIMDANGITFEFIATVSLLDTAIVAVLIRIFLSLSGESSSDVFIGRRPVGGEMLKGVLWLPVVFLVVTGVVLAIRAIAPWLHNVQTSPFEAFLSTPLQAAIFLIVVVLAGGVREELQRAFILHRFEQRLGGVKVGLLVFSLAFGAFHIDQGYDVAIAITLLGLFWGLMYVWRRSAVFSMVNHAAFNAAQVLQIMLVRSLDT